MDGLELTFGVHVETSVGEVVCLAGNIPELGSWKPSKAVILLRQAHSASEKGALWTRRVRLPVTDGIEYRFFVAWMRESEEGGDDKDVIVLRWETNRRPRVFNPSIYCQDPKSCQINNAEFGRYDGKEKVDRGWLTSQTEVRIRVHSNAVSWYKSRHNQQRYKIKCQAIDLRNRELIAGVDDDEESNHDVIHSTTSVQTLVSVLDGSRDEPFPQPHYGVIVESTEYAIFMNQSLEPEHTGYQLEFYLANHNSGPGDIPQNVGHAYLLPIPSKEATGSKTLPIIGLKHRPIGQVTIDWLMVKPLRGNPCDMSVTYARHWKHTRRPLDVGHRGMGSSHKAVFKECSAFRENTIASLADAGGHGADMVEFDVQLSKDKIPVIYHDFTVCLSMKKKSASELEFFEIGVNDLSCDQLQMLKVDHVSMKSRGGSPTHDASSDDPLEHQPFPRLKDVFEHIDKHVAFNIEIKYPLALKSTGELEEGLKHFLERNEYVDTILQEILTYGNSRRIILSCFDPEVCSMLRVKQNKYPVLFLTQGQTSRYPPYQDNRTSYTPMACYFCVSEGLLGVNAHTEDLLRDPQLIQVAKDRGLVVFCWGDDNNSKETIKQLKSMGVAAVIYDRISEFKESKENVFRMEQEAKEEMMKKFKNKVSQTVEEEKLLDSMGFHRVASPHRVETQFSVP